MAKRRIPVEGVKENELIKTLNENLNENEISPSQESLENNAKTESDNEINGYAQEVYDSYGTVITKEEPVTDAPQDVLDGLNTKAADAYNCGTEIVKNDISTFDKIESDRQREIKCVPHADKIGYANAGPSPVWDNTMAFKDLSPNTMIFKDLSPEAMEKLKTVISPVANSILERFDQTVNSLKDNEDCRKTVNSETNNSESLTDYGKKILEAGKKAGKKAGKIATGKDTEYEMVNHPSHYNQYDIEVIDMIIKIWGPEAAALWCDITAFKYRMRMGTKPNNSIEQDIKKEQWYLNKAKEIRASIVRENLIRANLINKN